MTADLGYPPWSSHLMLCFLIGCVVSDATSDHLVRMASDRMMQRKGIVVEVRVAHAGALTPAEESDFEWRLGSWPAHAPRWHCLN